MTGNDDDLPIVEVKVDGDISQTDPTLPRIKTNAKGTKGKKQDKLAQQLPP